MPNVPLPQEVPIQRAGWNTDFNPGGLLTPPNNERTPINPIMSGLNQASTQAQTALQGAQTANSLTELQQKQRGMQSSMLGALAALPPDQFEAKKSTVIGTINKLNPSMQYSPDIDQQTAQMAAMGGLPLAEQPTYGLNQSNTAINMALLRAMGGAPAAAAGATGGNMPQAPAENTLSSQSPSAIPSSVAPTQSSQPEGTMSPQAQALLALARPESSKALQGTPAYKEQEAEAETQGKNIADAKKGVIGIDSRIQNAINILNDQIKLAPKTFSGTLGHAQEGAERNLANTGMKFQGPSGQTTFHQNNENLFTQELPAIISSMPGSRLDIPLVKAIKDASSINDYGTPQEKIASAQNLKGLLLKLQENTHNNAAQMGAGNMPIPAINDANPPTAASQAQTKFPQKQTPQSTPIINTQAAFDALPSGSIYAESDGKKYRKP